MTAAPTSRSDRGRPPIVQYWHSAEIPPYIAEMMAGFSVHNPDLPHRVYDRDAAAELIATRFSPREVECFSVCAVPAMQSDYFRYCALFAEGGAYVDADFRCLGSLRPLIEANSALIVRAPEPVAGEAGREPRAAGPLRRLVEDRAGLPVHSDAAIAPGRVSGPPVVNSVLLFVQPGHPLLELTLTMATAAIERTRGGDVGGRGIAFITGSAILTGLRLGYELGSLEALGELLDGTAFAPLGRSVREAAGSYERLARAFAGVRQLTIEQTGAVGRPGIPLPYKRDGHWTRHTSGIYGARDGLPG